MTARRELREDERRAWLRLARTENVGPITFAALIARFGNAQGTLPAASRLARAGGAEMLRTPSDADIADEVERLAHLGGRIIACNEPDFPPALAALDPPPHCDARPCRTAEARSSRDCGGTQCIRAWH